MKNKPMESNGLEEKDMDLIDRHSNYRHYILFPNARKVDEERLKKVIEMLRDSRKGEGYIRFMEVSNNPSEEPLCTVYESKEKSSARMRGLVTLGELEEYLKLRAVK